jgi:transposase InsO family protein
MAGGHYVYSHSQGWLYLAAILDLYSKLIVGWSMKSRMTKRLVLDALKWRLTGGGQDPGWFITQIRAANMPATIISMSCALTK